MTRPLPVDCDYRSVTLSRCPFQRARLTEVQIKNASYARMMRFLPPGKQNVFSLTFLIIHERRVAAIEYN
jgi:hypothetical protein